MRLRKGFDDFWAMPTHVIFLSLIYPIAGLLIACAIFGYNLLPLLYPLAAGFALIGPFAAIGLYELSRRREQGLDTAWSHAFDLLQARLVPRDPRARACPARDLRGLDRRGASDLHRPFRLRRAGSITDLSRQVLTTEQATA